MVGWHGYAAGGQRCEWAGCCVALRSASSSGGSRRGLDGGGHQRGLLNHIATEGIEFLEDAGVEIECAVCLYNHGVGDGAVRGQGVQPCPVHVLEHLGVSDAPKGIEADTTAVVWKLQTPHGCAPQHLAPAEVAEVAGVGMRHNELRTLLGDLAHPCHVLHCHGGRACVLLPIRPVEEFRVHPQRGCSLQLVGEVERFNERMIRARVQRFFERRVHMVQVHDKLRVNLPGHAPLDEFADKVNRLRCLVRVLRPLLQLPRQARILSAGRWRRWRHRGRGWSALGGRAPLGIGRGCLGVGAVDDEAPRPRLQFLRQGRAAGGHAVLEGARALEDGAVAANCLLQVLRGLVHGLQHPDERVVRRLGRRPLGGPALRACVGGRQLLELVAQSIQVMNLAEGASLLERRA
mmetsp:Transcript_90392/g.269703  ORF Transcript_90392/g.269703 Transcript_90392/m.269703 type:complete len:405 (+) Transcript_90392:650-1864(+)